MSSKPKKLIKLLFLACIAGAVIFYALRYNRGDGPEPIRTTGTVEGVETSISSKVAGKLVFVGFREGETVKKGELIAAIEDMDLSAAKRQAEDAERAAASASRNSSNDVNSALAQVSVEKADVASQKAQLARAEAQKVQSDKDLARARELFAKGIISKSDMDAAETAQVSRAADVAAAKASVDLSGAREAAAQSALRKAKGDITTLAAQAAQARSGTEFAKAKLADTKLYSPVDAVVEYRSLEPGEVVSPGMGILTLIDPKALWVRIDLEQGYVGRVKTGQKAEVTLDRMPGKTFEGEVFDIGREGEFAVERDVQRGRQDIKTFRTRIRVKDPETVLKPGMTVLVRIIE